MARPGPVKGVKDLRKLSACQRKEIASSGGRARTEAMTSAQRTQLARKAAETRWGASKAAPKKKAEPPKSE